jgi:hemerythrin
MENKLVWEKKYEVGDYEIDSEHQIFLKIIIKIEKAYQNNSEKEYKVLLLKELFKYADFHFASEENKMIFFKYPDYESHMQEHKKLLSELSNQIGFYTLKHIDQNKLIDFLFNWFINHTTNLDLKFGDYLKKIKT